MIPVQQADGSISVYFCLAQAVGTLTPWTSFYHQVDNHGPAPTTRTYGYNVPKVVYFCLAQAVSTLTPWSSFYNQVDNHGPAPTTRTYGYNVPKVVSRMKVLMVKSARGRKIYEEPLTDMRPPGSCMMYDGHCIHWYQVGRLLVYYQPVWQSQQSSSWIRLCNSSW